MTYVAPLRDMQFVLTELAGLDQIATLPGCEEAVPDVVNAILAEAGKFASGVLAPLNRIGDREGAVWKDKSVTMPAGFRDAYRQFIENGWNGLDCNPEFGGQGLPRLVSAAVREMWKSANHAFSLCHLLTCGAIEALELCGTPEQKQQYLPKLVSGVWTGTMNITEPQAGSDLAAIRTRAEPQADGSFRIFGQKIFITYRRARHGGEHHPSRAGPHSGCAARGEGNLAVRRAEISAECGWIAGRTQRCLLRLHRTQARHPCQPDRPDELRRPWRGDGLSGRQGKRGPQDHVHHDELGALSVSASKVLGVAEASYQHALAYARERVQGRAIEGSAAPVAIVHHPDIRRMLMLMKSQIEAMRALAYVVAAAHDTALHHADAAERQRNQAFVDLMTPVVKGWLTETGNQIATLGVQVHGGMGYIEETGAAQFMRDARITTIYEGTTGIQANDLIGRKIARDGGATLQAVIGRMRATQLELAAVNDADCRAIAAALATGIAAVVEAGDYIVTQYAANVREVAAGAVPFLRLLGIVSGGWMMARAALVAQEKVGAGEMKCPERVRRSIKQRSRPRASTPSMY